MQVPFEQWFPLPLTWGTVLMFFVTLALVLAGSLVGLIFKELEVYQADNPKPFKFLTGENKMFLFLGVGISFGFWIMNTNAVQCFVIPIGLKAGLGTIRNYFTVKKNHANGGASAPASNVTASITGMGTMPSVIFPEQVTVRTPHVPPKVS